MAILLLADLKDLPVDPQEIHTQVIVLNVKALISSLIQISWTHGTLRHLTPYIVYDLVVKKEQGYIFQDEGSKTFLPMSMRPQAHDIIRTWAFLYHR